jgi:6-phosphofructokinase 1
MKTSPIGVFCSGGDSPGMNACIRAVVRTAASYGLPSIGIRRGYAGLIDGDLQPLDSAAVGSIIGLGGTILQSARSLEFKNPEGRARAAANLRAHGIERLVCIGGDGSYAGARQFLAEYPEFQIIGCPGTIDNDLYGTDYTIGYDTAINTAMWAIDRIRDTANSHGRLFFIEVMGKDAGFIALRAGIGGGAEAVLVPETPTDLDALADTIREVWGKRSQSVIVVVAEGDESGGAYEVARNLAEHFPGCDTKVSVIGHMQRGGSPTCLDRVLASRLGAAAVDALVEGRSGLAAGQLHREVAFVPFEEAIKHNQTLNAGLLRLVEVLRA